MSKIDYKPLGDSAVLVSFGSEITPEVNLQVRSFQVKIEEARITGVVDIIPAYADLLVVFNPLQIPFKTLLVAFKKLTDKIEFASAYSSKTLTIPVCYDGKFAPDMDFICSHTKLSKQEIIGLHTAHKYAIYMMGFTPGFCYLGGMDTRLSTPRKATPRTKIPAGAVGIAGNQTGIYPIASPGGWQVMGQTPIQLFQPTCENPFAVNPGDFIRFKSVSPHEFKSIEDAIINGTFEMEYE